MNIEEMSNRIIEAIPWRCFHCDFITMDRAEAEAHFGDRDDDSAFSPVCKWWASLLPEQRPDAMQDLLRQLAEERRENDRLSIQVEALEYQVESQEGVIRSYKPFKGCRTIHDVFCLYDSMEGRALAAEANGEKTKA